MFFIYSASAGHWVQKTQKFLQAANNRICSENKKPPAF